MSMMSLSGIRNLPATSLTETENIGISTPSGQVIRLGEIATVKEYWSPPNIERKRKERIVTVSVTPYKRPLNQIVADIQKELDQHSNTHRYQWWTYQEHFRI